MRTLNVRLLFFILSFLFYSTHVLAQTNFRDKMDGVFQNVDKSQVATQFLKESGYPFLALDRFNGTNLADTTLVDMDAWRMLYGTLLTSYVGTSKT